MLTELQRELISLAVGGRLLPAEEVAFRALLSDSCDAVALFQTLQSQAARLYALPRAALPAPRSANILRAIAAAPAPVAPSVTVRVPARSGRSWLPYAVAASTLLAVTGASFWAAHQPARPGANRPIEAALLPAVNPLEPAVPPALIASRPADLPGPQTGLPTPPREATPVELARVESPFLSELAPEPRVRPAGEIVGSGAFQQRPNLATLDIRLPILTIASKLDLPEVRTLTAAEVSSSPAVRLDLFSRDTLRGIQALQTAATSAGVTVAVDGLTAERMKKNQALVWAVYAESLTADDLAKWLDQVAVLNRGAGKDAPFGAAHLTTAAGPESRDLRDLLGVEPNFSKRIVAAVPNSVKASTLDQVALAMGKPVQGAILLTYAPANARTTPTTSAEVKTFLAARSDRKPGTTPVLIVVRPTN
jgi:hypothetical protein